MDLLDELIRSHHPSLPNDGWRPYAGW